LRRAYRHLKPGGALLITNHVFPYGETDETRWARWLPGQRAGIPREWPTDSERRRFSDGDEVEWLDRLADFDPLGQRLAYDVRVRLWRGEQMVKEEAYSLKENLYFAQEILLMLAETRFRDVVIEAYPTGRPANADDGTVAFVASK
jgi:hypothetical protein